MGRDKSWVQILNDPYLVASFQSLCGVKSLDKSFSKKDRNSNSQSDDSISSKENLNYVIENKVLFYLAHFGSGLGDEVFYAVFFPFWAWNIDGPVCRKIVLLWALLMYIGQGLKDVIRWPRPSSPPVIRLEKKWELEYGMPSTHAVVSSVIPLSLLYFTHNRYQYDMGTAVGISIIWITVVCLSRLYLGMHSILDVLAGLSLVLILFNILAPLVSYFDPIFTQNPYGSFYLFLCGVILGYFSPGGDRWTPARGDTFVILGTAVGLNSGAWLNYQLGFISGVEEGVFSNDEVFKILVPTLCILFESLTRLIIGLLIVYATKGIIKKIGANFIPKFSSLSYMASPDKKQVLTELIYKFMLYTALGVTVVFICPIAFRALGIQRPSFESEI